MSDTADAHARLARELASTREELHRVRTTGHGAAHELDNIAVELGLGHSPKPGAVAEKVRSMIPPKGHIIDDQGVVRKVLGKLPITVDGAVAAEAIKMAKEQQP